MKLLKRIGLAVFVNAIILLALVMGGMRLVISNIDLFESKIAYLLERDVSKGIVFNRLSGEMNRFNPVLQIDNISINLADRSQPLFIDSLQVEFDFWSSLREGAPVVFEITGELEKLELTRDRSGQWWLDEFRVGSVVGDTDLPGFSHILALLPRYLKLDLRRLIVHDEKHQATHQLAQVAARIIHREERFFTQASALLPDELGRSLLLKSVVGESGSRVYLNSSDLKLAPVARLFDLDTHGLKSGALDGELWLEMSGYRVTGVQGDLALKNGVVQVSGDKPLLAIDYRARFNALERDHRWQVSTAVERLSIDGEAVPGFIAQLDVPMVDGDDRLAASIDRLPISSLPVIAGQWLPSTLHSQISEGRLQGLLRDVIFEIDLDRPETFRLGAQVSDLGNKAFGRFPGIDKVDARLVMGNNRLAASLQGDAVSIDFGDQFRAPLQADSLRMEVTLNRTATGNLLVAADDIHLRNQDLSAVGRLRLETDAGQAPFMYLRANFSDAVGSSTGKYIPIRLMPRKTVEWLDRGIIDGFVPEGELQYHGRLRDIRDLAREQAVEFFVDFGVQRANIFFAPGWLNAKNGNGRVLFHNVGVEFDLQSTSYEQIEGISVRGGIANFGQPVLDLEISTEASSGDALRVFRGMPVAQRFAEVLDRLQDLDGNVGSEIDIRLPLSEDVGEREVNVQVDFKDAAARVPQWGLDLSQITGRLKVSGNKLEGADISARFFDDPVRIDVSSSDSAIDTEVAVRGKMASANLLRSLPGYLAEAFGGDSQWQVLVNIAGDAAPAERPFLRIEASSDMRDTRVDLPPPLRKEAADTQRFSAQVNFFPRRIQFSSLMGRGLQGRGSLRETTAGEYRLETLDLAFASEFRTEQRRGVNIYGRISELPVDDWLAFFERSGEKNPALLNYLLLGVDGGEAFGRRFESAVIELQQVDERFNGSIDASIVKGRFEFPLKATATDPIILDLDYLVVDKNESEADYSALRPSQLSTFRLGSKSLSYHGMTFSDLLIEARPRGETLHVKTFDLRRDALHLKGKGKWKYDAGKDSHSSSFSARITGPMLGEAIDGLGFGKSLSGGEIDFKGDFNWPAPLLAVGLESLSGKAQMEITHGVLNNVEPGNGRFVGLLSLSALPRRLSLDFSDVIIGGMDFDEINGSYRLEQGVLYTEDTRMDGPAAKIEISGKTDIINRDYDQLIQVTPRIRQTLPLLGAISAGSTVGWGLLLLQNLFKTAIDDAVEVEYRVTGGWDDPQIELIKAVDENQKALPKIDK